MFSSGLINSVAVIWEWPCLGSVGSGFFSFGGDATPRRSPEFIPKLTQFTCSQLLYLQGLGDEISP